MTRDDIVEAGAKAHFEETQELDQDLTWEELPDDWRDEHKYLMDAALTAMLPLILAVVAEYVTESLYNEGEEPGVAEGLRLAARLIEGWTP